MRACMCVRVCVCVFMYVCVHACVNRSEISCTTPYCRAELEVIWGNLPKKILSVTLDWRPLPTVDLLTYPLSLLL